MAQKVWETPIYIYIYYIPSFLCEVTLILVIKTDLRMLQLKTSGIWISSLITAKLLKPPVLFNNSYNMIYVSVYLFRTCFWTFLDNKTKPKKKNWSDTVNRMISLFLTCSLYRLLGSLLLIGPGIAYYLVLIKMLRLFIALYSHCVLALYREITAVYHLWWNLPYAILRRHPFVILLRQPPKKMVCKYHY